jgi:hypothetical protein
VREVLHRMDPPCEIRARTSRPIFVARVAPRTPDVASDWRTWRGADVLAPREEQLDAVRAWWHLGFRMEVLTGAVGRAKGVPFVVTCGGLVVLGAEIVDLDEELRKPPSRQGAGYTRRAVAFTLDAPGAWFDGQYGRRFSTGAGGPFRLIHGIRGRRPSIEA